MSDSPASTEYKPLSEVVAPINAKVTLGKDPDKPYVGLENIPSRGSKLLSWEKADSSISTNSVFTAGDVLFGKLRPNLRKCVAAPFDGYCSTDVLVLRAKDGIAPDFAVRVLQSEKIGATAERSAIGTKMPRTAWEHLSDAVVFCPEVTEQRKVAGVLDTLDAAIQKTEAIIEKLKQVKQGLLHDLLTRGVDENGEVRRSYEHAPHLYQASRLGWIPKDWSLRSVSSLGEIGSGSTPSRAKFDRYFHPDGMPWVKTLDLNEDVVHETDECITAAALRENSCSVLPASSVLVAMYGGWEQIGRTAMLGVPAATNQAISTVTINDPDVVPEYVLRALQHGRPRWKRVAASTRKDPNITKVDVETFELPMPSTRDEQIAIVTRFRALLTRLAVEQLELHKRQEEKAGVMDDLLTGRVRVTPLLAQ